jgi:hypothetical protein
MSTYQNLQKFISNRRQRVSDKCDATLFVVQTGQGGWRRKPADDSDPNSRIDCRYAEDKEALQLTHYGDASNSWSPPEGLGDEGVEHILIGRARGPNGDGTNQRASERPLIMSATAVHLSVAAS